MDRLRNDVLSSKKAQIDLSEQRKADAENRGRHYRSLMDLVDHHKDLKCSTNNRVAGDEKYCFVAESGIPCSRMSYLVVDPELGSDPLYHSADLGASIHLSQKASRSPTLRIAETIDNLLKHPQRRSTKKNSPDKSTSTMNQSKFRREFTLFEKFHAKNRISKLKLALSAGGKLSCAFDLLKNAVENIDPPRLYFQAGLLFDDVNVHDKAIQCFGRSVNQLNIFDFKEKETASTIRKFQMMNCEQQRKLLINQELRRITYIKEEKERQQLRSIISHIKLVRLRIIIGDFLGSYNSLLAAFEQRITRDEHILVLQLMHIFLSEMSVRAPALLQLLKLLQLLSSAVSHQAITALNAVSIKIKSCAVSYPVITTLNTDVPFGVPKGLQKKQLSKSHRSPYMDSKRNDQKRYWPFG